MLLPKITLKPKLRSTKAAADSEATLYTHFAVSWAINRLGIADSDTSAWPCGSLLQRGRFSGDRGQWFGYVGQIRDMTFLWISKNVSAEPSVAAVIGPAIGTWLRQNPMPPPIQLNAMLYPLESFCVVQQHEIRRSVPRLAVIQDHPIGCSNNSIGWCIGAAMEATDL